MGYGMPGAIGAKIGNPDTPVISISGDGGFQMNSQELATAVLEELPIISCIFNNKNLGMVRQWQKLFYGKRYSMTNLRSGAASRRAADDENFEENRESILSAAKNEEFLELVDQWSQETEVTFNDASVKRYSAKKMLG